jgi:tetratricopeptide (TPR) repeat protein
MSANTFPCPNCDSPLEFPELVHAFAFPDELEPTIALVEGRLNSRKCPLCGTMVPILTDLVVVFTDQRLAVYIGSKLSDQIDAEVRAAAPPDFRIQSARDYNELWAALVPLLDSYMTEPTRALLSGEFDRLPRREQIDKITPLLLCLVKSQADDVLPVRLVTEGEALPPAKVREFVQGFFVALVSDQLERLVLEAAFAGTLLLLADEIRVRVPQACLTDAVLRHVAEQCRPVREPLGDTEQFVAGFRSEFLNAECHAYAGLPNPRKREWAQHARLVWMLSGLPNVQLDPQFMLSPAIAARTLPFGDLWDAFVESGSLHAPKEESRVSGSIQAMTDDLGGMMKHFGYEEQLTDHISREGMFSFVRGGEPGTPLPEGTPSLAEALRNELAQRVQWNGSPVDAEFSGGVVAMATQSLLKSAFAEDAERLAEEMQAAALKRGDRLAAMAIAAKCTRELNRFERYEAAAALVDRALSTLRDDLDDFPPHMLVDFFNEAGNVLRYMHHYARALDAYNVSLGLTPGIENEETAAASRLVLERNRAIVLRQMGRYTEALQMFRTLVDDAPHDAELQHNIAVLFMMVGRWRDALLHVQQAIDHHEGRASGLDALKYFTSRAWIRLHLNDDGGIADLELAFDTFPADADALRGRVAAAALSFEPRAESGRRFLSRAEDFVRRLLDDRPQSVNASAVATITTALTERLIRTGEHEEAGRLLARLLNDLGARQSNVPWQLAFSTAHYLHENGDQEQSWSFLELALADLEEKMPEGSEAEFAAFWLRDKHALQALLALVALERFRDQRVAGSELITVFEFANGRDITARLGASAISPQEILDGLSAAAEHLKRRIVVVFFCETAERVQAVWVTSDGGEVKLLEGLEWPLAEIIALRDGFARVLKRANPSAPENVDPKLREWNALGAGLGAVLAPELADGTHVCFLPGRVMTGLPLHLVPLPDGTPLLAAHTVSVAPNFTTLLAGNAAAVVGAGNEVREDRTRTWTVVTVPKTGDNEAFRSRARAVADRIAARLEPLGHVRRLDDLDATRATVQHALAHSTEVAFLCHGKRGEHEGGVGICLSDGDDLPPTILAPEQVPAHGRFLFTWEDVSAAPEVFVSAACSSGVVEVAVGGARFGFEQTVFGGGTRVIASPLWDIDQESALVWLDEFYRLRAEDPTTGLADAYRSASLSTRQRFPHFYHWGAFALTGSILSL